MSTTEKNHTANPEIPKSIRLTAKTLEKLSPGLATFFAARIFMTPIKHRSPKREHHMINNSWKESLQIPSIHKEISVYHYGKSNKKALLVHGWSGRGTQLVKIADMLLDMGYMTISFDAPAHGKSKGNISNMYEFIACIHELNKKYGPFETAIGHSLGGMSVLNAVKQGFETEKAVIIGSGDIIQDIIDDFIAKMELSAKIGKSMKHYFEKKYNQTMDDYSAYIAAKEVKIPVLVIHDENDEDVPVRSAGHIAQHLSDHTLMITKGLGHRKILGDPDVLNQISQFIKK